ncbi:hypothetical protein ACFQ51_45500 [Streptomyces kaempferi]
MPVSSEKLQDRLCGTVLALPGVSSRHRFAEQMDVCMVAGKVSCSSRTAQSNASSPSGQDRSYGRLLQGNYPSHRGPANQAFGTRYLAEWSPKGGATWSSRFPIGRSPSRSADLLPWTGSRAPSC